MTDLTTFLLDRVAEAEYDARTRSLGRGWRKQWLAECEAMRRIVARHRPFSHGRCQACYHLEDQDEWTANLWPCPDLRDLALPYADHSDYREAWRP